MDYIAHQAPLSLGFSRQEYWSGLSSPPPGDLSDPGIKPTSLYFSCIGRRVFSLTINITWEAPQKQLYSNKNYFKKKKDGPYTQ